MGGSDGHGPLDPAELYREESHNLIRFASSLVGPTDALDVFANAVVKVLAAPGWRTADDPRAYLYRAVFNEAKSWHRSAFRRRRREHWAPPGVVSGPEVPRPEILGAVAALSLRQRAVVVLTYWADLSPEMIADRLGISEGAVRSHLARARQKLREVLDA